MFKLLQKPIGNEQNIKHNYFQNPTINATDGRMFCFFYLGHWDLEILYLPSGFNVLFQLSGHTASGGSLIHYIEERRGDMIHVE